MSDSQRKVNSHPDWAAYYAKTGDRPPRPTLIRAADAFAGEGGEAGRLAVDLGCGMGRDALPLLRRGWRVLAIDSEPRAIEGLIRRAQAEGLTELEGRVERMEDARLPATDLVNSSFALFACELSGFPALWAGIRGSLRPGGRFSGQLLGPKDSWAGRAATLVVSRTELGRLCSGFEVEMLLEEQDDSVTPRGEAKHWHIWHLLLRKPPS
jgi:tellurite methyltransferase